MGIISNKLRKKFQKLDKRKIINFSELEEIKKKQKEIESIMKINFNEKEDPSHKIYSISQNLLSFLSEEFAPLIEFSDFTDTISDIQEEYMPSYPPMSPLTTTYFNFWCFNDFEFGKEKETLSSIVHELFINNNLDEIIVQASLNMRNSNMSFYIHEGFDDKLIVLREILSNEKYNCICPAGYIGNKGEIWFARVVQNLDQIYNYHIVVTTPYVILKYKEKDWIEFFKRQGIENKKGNYKVEFKKFLKNNPNIRYWHDYIMDAYVNYTDNFISKPLV